MDKDDIGMRFQKLTKHTRPITVGEGLDWDNKPSTYKDYPAARRFPLPPPQARTSSVEEAIRRRKSVRKFTPGPMALEDLSFLLWASTGMREKRGNNEFRTSPSAGALYPIETYVAVNSVVGLVPGLYHYSIRDHHLELLKEGSLGKDLSAAALGQNMCADAPVALVLTAVFERTVWKYGQRGYRYVYLDAAHVAAQMTIAATSVGLGSCQIAATYDEEINGLLGVDGERESFVYMSVVGRPFERA